MNIQLTKASERHRKYGKFEGRKAFLKNKKLERECLDCNAAFIAMGSYNRMCDICKRKYRSVLWAS